MLKFLLQTPVELFECTESACRIAFLHFNMFNRPKVLAVMSVCCANDFNIFSSQYEECEWLRMLKKAPRLYLAWALKTDFTIAIACLRSKMNLIYLYVAPPPLLFPIRSTKSKRGHGWESRRVWTCTSVYAGSNSITVTIFMCSCFHAPPSSTFSHNNSMLNVNLLER